MNDLNTNAEITTNEPKPTEETKQKDGESISGYVKAEVLQQLIEMGFSKNASEKALFFNKSNFDCNFKVFLDFYFSLKLDFSKNNLAIAFR